MIANIGKFPWTYLIRFFAGFCLIVNGCYIGVGSFGRRGHAGIRPLRHGSPMWTLWLFGLLTVPLGLYLWNGNGAEFCTGLAEGKVDSHAAERCFPAFFSSRYSWNWCSVPHEGGGGGRVVVRWGLLDSLWKNVRWRPRTE